MKNLCKITFVIIASILILLYLGKGFVSYVEYTLSVINIIFLIVTMVIAIALYSKYGIEKKVTEKQAEAVLALMSELKRLHFFFTYNNGVTTVYLDDIKSKHLHQPNIAGKNIGKEHIGFDQSYYAYISNIANVSKNIFLPQVIASKLQFLVSSPIIPKTKKNSSISIKVETEYSVNYLTTEQEYNRTGLLGGEELTVDNFMHKWELVVIECFKWLKDHSTEELKLNFFIETNA